MLKTEFRPTTVLRHGPHSGSLVESPLPEASPALRLSERRKMANTRSIDTTKSLLSCSSSTGIASLVEEDLVVLADGLVLIVFDGLADGDDPAGNDGNFVAVGEDNTGFGFALVFILA